MKSINVLIVDSNILVRRALINILQQRSDLFKVKWINNDQEVVSDVIKANGIDVVLLSVDNASSEDFMLLQQLNQEFPHLPIIVISPRNNDGAEAVIAALRMGAVDFITKPHHKNLILFAERHLQKRLMPLLKAAKRLKSTEETNQKLESLVHPQQAFEQMSAESLTGQSPKIVVVGGCTGGIKSLFAFISNITELDIPIVIVQHLPRNFTSLLAEKLDDETNVNVEEARTGTILEKGIYIAPGGYQCEIEQSGHQRVLNIHRGLRVNNMRPSIDVLFNSAARIYKQEALGILLSGCGYDGLAGGQEIKAHGGQLIVEDPRKAVAAELPLAAIRKGLTREFYDAEGLSEQIKQRITAGGVYSERPMV